MPKYHITTNTPVYKVFEVSGKNETEAVDTWLHSQDLKPISTYLGHEKFVEAKKQK